MAAALFTDPTGTAILFLGLFTRPVAASLLVLAIATVAYNIYQAVRKAVRAAAATPGTEQRIRGHEPASERDRTARGRGPWGA